MKTPETEQKSGAKTIDGLTLQQEEFCQVYTSHDREMFGNGFACYMEVYGDEYAAKHDGRFLKPENARSKASQLLTKVNIIARINALLEEGGFNDQNVDKQHLFLLNQHGDLRTKMSAIKEYNAVKGRVTKKLEHSGSIDLEGLLDE